MKIALIGDSTTETYYLRRSDNPALASAPWNKPVGYDFSLGPAIASYLSGVTHEIGNFARGGFDTGEALSTSVAYQTGVYGSPITYTGTMWEAAKSWSPDAIVISFGLNDQAASMPVATFEANLDTIMGEASSLGILIYAWNGHYYQFGPSVDSYSQSLIDGMAPYQAAIESKCAEYGGTFIDTRAAWQASCLAGTWDLFAHMDSTYLAAWENGSSPPAVYRNVHQWIGGQEIIASSIADALGVIAQADPDSINLSISGTPPFLIERRVV